MMGRGFASVASVRPLTRVCVGLGVEEPEELRQDAAGFPLVVTGMMTIMTKAEPCISSYSASRGRHFVQLVRT